MDGRVRRILDDSRGKKVTHIGCVDAPFTRERVDSGSLLHLHLNEVASELIGIDVDSEGLKILGEAVRDARLFTPQDAPDYSGYAADIVVVGEVIEHIVDFVEFGRMLRRLSGPSTLMIVTTPNAYSLKAVLRALVGTEQQHPDHKCLFSWKTLEVLMRNMGFRTMQRSSYNNPPRRIITLPIGYAINAVLNISPRAADGLYFTFQKE